MLLSVSDVVLRYMMLSSAKSRMGDRMLLFRSYMYNRNRTGRRTEPCGTPDITHVLSHRAPLTESLCFRCERNNVFSFWVFPIIPQKINFDKMRL